MASPGLSKRNNFKKSSQYLTKSAISLKSWFWKHRDLFHDDKLLKLVGIFVLFNFIMTLIIQIFSTKDSILPSIYYGRCDFSWVRILLFPSLSFSRFFSCTSICRFSINHFNNPYHMI